MVFLLQLSYCLFVFYTKQYNEGSDDLDSQTMKFSYTHGISFATFLLFICVLYKTIQYNEGSKQTTKNQCFSCLTLQKLKTVITLWNVTDCYGGDMSCNFSC